MAIFSSSASPIGVDFGTSSVKLLQVGGGDPPELVAAAEVVYPDAVRQDPIARLEYCAEVFPSLLKEAGFRGRKAVCAVPSPQTHVQHMQLVGGAGISADDQVKSQLQTQLGVGPSSVVVRCLDVCQVHRDGQALDETICFAMSRETVMRHVELLKRCRLEVTGVHMDAMAMVRVFDHINRREGDENVATLYVDLGWGGTRAAVAHGKKIVFAREIHLGGRQFDQQLASALNCDLPTARQHRLQMDGTDMHQLDPRRAARLSNGEGMALLDAAQASQAADQQQKKRGLFGRRSAEAQPEPAASEAPAAVADDRRSQAQLPAVLAANVAPANEEAPADEGHLEEPVDVLADELSMSLRYHAGLYGGKTIDRVILLGGEARQVWLCRQLVKKLRIPAQLGDPLMRLSTSGKPETPGLSLDTPQPGWAVACGLCTAIDQ